jgi:hypothetical protein
LNARIPDATLEQLLTGNLYNSCYRCDICLDENVSNTNMSNCEFISCPNYSCNFVARRGSTTGLAQCNSGWHFSSNCILSREPAQVDMTIMYYIRSKTIVLYQMVAICLSDNCNNITTFQQLKDAVTVDPDLSCLIDDTSSSTTYSSTSSTTTITGSTVTTSSTGSIVTTSSTGSIVTTSSTGSTTTTQGSSAEKVYMNTKLFILIFFSFYITIKY